MDEHPEIGPALGEVAERSAGRLARPRHPLEQDDDPRGHPPEQPEILFADELGDQPDPALPVVD
jgi:hypothetical protein